jgi:hypothetical protein
MYRVPIPLPPKANSNERVPIPKAGRGRGVPPGIRPDRGRPWSEISPPGYNSNPAAECYRPRPIPATSLWRPFAPTVSLISACLAGAGAFEPSGPRTSRLKARTLEANRKASLRRASVPVPARGSQNEHYLIEMLTKCTDARGVSHWRHDDVSIRDSRGRPTAEHGHDSAIKPHHPTIAGKLPCGL